MSLPPRRRAPERFTPGVSIVVPAYNEATDIGQSLRSLAAGDYPSFEVIVVDDGSTDGTAGIVERMRLSNVRLLRQERRARGGAVASVASTPLRIRPARRRPS